MWSQVSSVHTRCVLGWDGRCPVYAQIQPGAGAGKVTRSPLPGRLEMDRAMLSGCPALSCQVRTPVYL